MILHPMLLTVFAIAALTSTTFAAENPIELGKVQWLRDYDQAATQAKKSNRSLLVLFQEVPG